MADEALMIGELRADVRNLQQSNRDLWEAVNEQNKALHEFTITITKMTTELKQAAAEAADWGATKKRGILYLAAAGASGIAGTLGFQKLGPLVFAILK